ncbi:MAG: hypothetical protein FJW36_09550 [Acidobacteria bacterium]|nr:hypothetical protein [Acidobacteriota bacterium]
MNNHIVTACLRREPSIDFLSAARAGIDSLPDQDLLQLAQLENRILVTHDYRTMPAHFANYLLAGNRCPGVFLVHHTTSIALASEWLLLAWAASTEEEWRDRIVEIPH